MDFLHMILLIALLGVILYLINTYVPMETRIKSILNWVVIIALVLWILNAFGVFAYLSTPVARIHK